MANVARMMRALEIKADQYYFEKKLLPEGMEDQKLSSRPVEYFKKYGFKVPTYFSDIYYKYNGIESEKYISTGFYNYVVTPYLMNLNLFQAYDDKNIYSILFPDILQPRTIVKNLNGRFYLPDSKYCVGDEISTRDVLDSLHDYKQFIIKPAMETGGGKNVCVYEGSQLSRNQLLDILKVYNQDFIVQEILFNHPALSKLNTSSLNTCRLVTYRRPNSSDYILLGAFIRFGAVGAIMDNATSGGGFCKIENDGTVDDKIWSCRHIESRFLSHEKGIESLVIPQYSEMVSTVLKLHRRLPYCDLIGWDMTVTDSNQIALIEYNPRPDCEGFQIVHGPFFGKYTDELMECLTSRLLENVFAVKTSFPGMAKQNHHIFDFSEMDKL